MPIPAPELGLVISCAYLWNSEFEKGEDEGLKDRPCAVVLSSRDEGGGHNRCRRSRDAQPPERPEEAVDIPPSPKRRLGLDEARSWVVVSEMNRFVWPGPDLRPVSRAEPERFEYGFLPPALFRRVIERFEACVTARRLRTVPRTE